MMLFQMESIRYAEPPGVIWEFIAGYANGDQNWPKSWQTQENTILYGRLKHEPSASVRTAHFLVGLNKLTKAYFKRAVADLERDRGKFKEMLAWFCAVNPRSGKLNMRKLVPREILAFLTKRTVSEFHHQLHSVGSGILCLSSGTRNPVGVLCRFLLENSGIATSDIPIRICRRDGCGRFFVQRRESAEFCSASCRARNYAAHLTLEEKNQYMKEYRLEKLAEKLLKLPQKVIIDQIGRMPNNARTGRLIEKVKSKFGQSGSGKNRRTLLNS